MEWSNKHRAFARTEFLLATFLLRYGISKNETWKKCGNFYFISSSHSQVLRWKPGNSHRKSHFWAKRNSALPPSAPADQRWRSTLKSKEVNPEDLCLSSGFLALGQRLLRLPSSTLGERVRTLTSRRWAGPESPVDDVWGVHCSDPSGCDGIPCSLRQIGGLRERAGHPKKLS
jgi:hypothetical protein